MSHKSKINKNNEDLQKILNAINEMPESLDTSDATATSSDIAIDKSAYVNGEKIEGCLPDNDTVIILNNASPSFVSDKVRMTGYIQEDMILREDTPVMTSVGSSSFGNATAADVASGKTFTSASGFKVTGTLVPAQGKFSKSTGSFSMNDYSHSIKSVSSNAFFYGAVMSNNSKVGSMLITIVDSVATVLIGYGLITFTPSYSGTTLTITQSKTQNLTISYTIYNVV